VFLCVRLNSFIRVRTRVNRMPSRCMGVMGCLLVIAGVVVFGGLTVMSRRIRMVFGGLPMMFGRFLGHNVSSLTDWSPRFCTASKAFRGRVRKVIPRT
jgi:uncharacterized membrane protein HdeD (DUF308 family)